MQKSVSRRSPDPRTSVWIVFAMLAMIILPAAITLNAVRLPGELQIREEEDPTPYGYSWSLLLFIVPILVIAFVFLPRAEIKIPRKASGGRLGSSRPSDAPPISFSLAASLFLKIQEQPGGLRLQPSTNRSRSKNISST